jgi:DNA topoisomerase-2
MSGLYTEKQTISDFLNIYYKAYARYCVESRAIPHFTDGLKPVQRKALAAAMRYCNDRRMNVSALGGQTKGNMDYRHGDTSVQGAIIVMAQEFMQGMPYLERHGQFGSLYIPQPGAARYIYVQLSGWSKLVMRDEAELQYNLHEDTGEKVEPKYYLPIIPMMLINGTDGIAVGFATSFANYNPLEVATVTLECVKNGTIPEYNLTPFVHGHTGLWSYWNGKFEHVAPWHRKNTTVLSIDGLPIDTTIEKYKGYLNVLIEQGHIKRYDDLCSKDRVLFEIHMTQNYLDQLIAENGVAGLFHLIYRLPTDNLTCVMPNNAIKRFSSPCQFIREFVDFRLKFYVKRKKRMLRDIGKRIDYLCSLVKFIELVNDGTIVFKGKNKKELEQECIAWHIDPTVVHVQIYNLTDGEKAKHQNEVIKLQNEYEKIQATTERQMYINDLEELLMHIRKYYKVEPVINLKQEYLLRPLEA